MAHSWMTCPQSIDPRPGRGGNTQGPCEAERSVWEGGPPLHEYRAGTRLKVGWPSNNHGGGVVRLALVPTEHERNSTAFDENVLKFACYGWDERSDGTYDGYGGCKHPCNGRGGCLFMTSTEDKERYDTTITLPTNLPTGQYTLQWVSAMSAHRHVYYSCARIQITGGDPSLSCPAPSVQPPDPGCKMFIGLSYGDLVQGTRLANFCYTYSGGTAIDAQVTQRPSNVDCDPRVSCQLSVAYDYCRAQQGMTSLLSPSNPRQDCGSQPSCTDGIQNQDETGVDCGGISCPSCPSSCSDGIQNHGELGVDCGGPCTRQCISCFNGIQDGSEQGVDCGGSCTRQCTSCFNGIQDGSEQGVDCGGPCTRQCTSCFNGIQDGSEQGVDCGGTCQTSCVVVPPTCSDGIQNQGETGVDCGGPCGPCSRSIITVSPTSKWTGGAIYQLTVVAAEIMASWNVTVHFTDPIQIRSTWGLVFRNPDDINKYQNIYMFHSASWNGNLRPNQIATGGFFARFYTNQAPTVDNYFFNCGNCVLRATMQ